MNDKGWRHNFEIRHHPHYSTFGHSLEYYRWVPGWPSITLTVAFWHRTYILHLYKMGED